MNYNLTPHPIFLTLVLRVEKSPLPQGARVDMGQVLRLQIGTSKGTVEKKKQTSLVSLRDLGCVECRKVFTEAIFSMSDCWQDCFGGHLLLKPTLNVSQ